MNSDREEAKTRSSGQLIAQKRQLHAVQNSQFRLTRWFGGWMWFAGLALIPSGFTLPWPLDVRLIAIGVTMLLLWLASLYFRARRVIPPSWHIWVAVVLWILLSIAFDFMLPVQAPLGVGLAAAVAATIPFYVIGSYFLFRRPAGTHDTYQA